MTMKYKLFLVVFASIVALVAPGVTQSLAQTPSPKSGGTLVVAQSADIKGFDPHTLPDFQTVRALGLIYETLVATDANLKIVPALAQSCQFSSDGLKLQLNLPQAVTFPDHYPSTSA